MCVCVCTLFAAFAISTIENAFHGFSHNSKRLHTCPKSTSVTDTRVHMSVRLTVCLCRWYYFRHYYAKNATRTKSTTTTDAHAPRHSLPTTTTDTTADCTVSFRLLVILFEWYWEYIYISLRGFWLFWSMENNLIYVFFLVLWTLDG